MISIDEMLDIILTEAVELGPDSFEEGRSPPYGSGPSCSEEYNLPDTWVYTRH